MGYPIRVKICGITNEEDLLTCLDAGADAIGLNFHLPSPRYVIKEVAQALLSRIPPFVVPVAVVVQPPENTIPDEAPTPFARKRIGTLTHFPRIAAIQIHGPNPEIFPSSSIASIPAFQARSREDLAEIDIFLMGHSPAAVLVDGYAPDLAGGTGNTAPWQLLADWHPRVPLILAGGLTPENVADAVRIVRPYAVDVASGVESAPGKKDPAKVRAFIRAAKQAAANLDS